MAQVEVASLLEKGTGLKQDFVAAASYYQKAADQGNPAGMSGIGTMLRFGRGVKKDTAAAARSVCWLPMPVFLHAFNLMRDIGTRQILCCRC